MSAPAYQIYPGYLDPARVREILDFATANSRFFRTVPANKLRMNTPYRILDGEDLRQHFPRVMELVKPIHELTEKLAGQRLVLFGDDIRNVRLHRYEGGEEGLLWHIDGALYTSIVTLENANGSGIEIFSLRKSRVLSLLVYPLYLFQPLFKLFGPRRIVLAPGDMIVMHGGEAVHRTFDDGVSGQRTIFAISFASADKKFSLRAFLLNWLNVTVRTIGRKNKKADGGYY